VIYKQREAPFELRSFAKKIKVDPQFPEPPVPYKESCMDYRPFYIRWKEHYGTCINKSVVTYPEMLKHANKGTRD